MTDTRALAATIAAVDLPTSRRPPSSPLDDVEFSSLLTTVRHQRLEGPLARAVATAWLPTTDEQAERVAEAHDRAMATALVLDRQLLALAPALDAAGARWRVLKGSAAAHLDEDDPSRRSYGDIDLLVAAEDLAAVHRLLEGLGGRRHHREPGEGYDRRFGKGAAHTLPGQREVDVHRTLALGPYGICLRPEDLFAASDTFVLAGRPLLALDRPRRFLHACYHAVLGQDPPRLVALRDVARTLPDGPGARTAHGLARVWQGEAVVAAALVDVVAVLGLDVDHPLVRWAHELAPRTRDRRWLAAHRGPSRSSRARSLLVLEALPGAADRMAYARLLIRSLRQGRRVAPPSSPGTTP